jgi:hypothetical protein
MNRVSAFGCLRRGFASLRANWGLVWVQWLQAVLVWLLFVAGAFLLLSTLGLDLAASYAFLIEGETPALTRQLERHLESFSPALLGAAVGALALWTFAFFVYCWFQAGTYGVLIAAERQAAPGPPRDRRFFRTFSARDFAGWAGRYLWRYFWLLNLFALLSTPVLVLAAIWLVLLGVAAESAGAPAAIGLGCGGALPLGFLCAVLALGLWLAMADAAREGSGVGRAARHGLRVLGRRLGASSLLAFLAVVFVGMQATTVFALSLVLQAATDERTVTRMAAVLSLHAAEWLVSSVVTVFLGAAAVALVQGEVRREPPGETRKAAA